MPHVTSRDFRAQGLSGNPVRPGRLESLDKSHDNFAKYFKLCADHLKASQPEYVVRSTSVASTCHPELATHPWIHRYSPPAMNTLKGWQNWRGLRWRYGMKPCSLRKLFETLRAPCSSQTSCLNTSDAQGDGCLATHWHCQSSC